MIPIPYYGDTPDESPVSARDEYDDALGFALDAEDEAESCDPNDHATREELWFVAARKWAKCDPCRPSDRIRVREHILKCRDMYRLAEASALLEILS